MSINRKSSPVEIAAASGVSMATYTRWKADPESVSKASRTAIERTIGEPTDPTAAKLDRCIAMLEKMQSDMAIVMAIREERRAAEGGDR